MIKSVLAVFAASSLAIAAPALAQDHNHDHDHSAHAGEPSQIDIDHIFDEAEDDHSIGSLAAPVSLIIYASVTCPHCSDWFTNEWPTFKTDHVETGNVRVTFREFPTAPAQIAMIGFTIANCAPEDQFFAQIEKLMVDQKDIFASLQGGGGFETFASYMNTAGLDTEAKREACFEEPAHLQRIQRAMMRAEAGGINSVPAFVLDGEIYKGDNSASGLDKVVSERVNIGFTPIPSP